MNEFEIRPISEVPERFKAPGLAATVRNLKEDEAVFVKARDGETLERMRQRLTGAFAGPGLHSRIDREKNGYWIFRDGDKP